MLFEYQELWCIIFPTFIMWDLLGLLLQALSFQLVFSHGRGADKACKKSGYNLRDCQGNFTLTFVFPNSSREVNEKKSRLKYLVCG